MLFKQMSVPNGHTHSTPHTKLQILKFQRSNNEGSFFSFTSPQCKPPINESEFCKLNIHFKEILFLLQKVKEKRGEKYLPIKKQQYDMILLLSLLLLLLYIFLLLYTPRTVNIIWIILFC